VRPPPVRGKTAPRRPKDGSGLPSTRKRASDGSTKSIWWLPAAKSLPRSSSSRSGVVMVPAFRFLQHAQARRAPTRQVRGVGHAGGQSLAPSLTGESPDTPRGVAAVVRSPPPTGRQSIWLARDAHRCRANGTPRPCHRSRNLSADQPRTLPLNQPAGGPATTTAHPPAARRRHPHLPPTEHWRWRAWRCGQSMMWG
jgi:hypothetical protein